MGIAKIFIAIKRKYDLHFDIILQSMTRTSLERGGSNLTQFRQKSAPAPPRRNIPNSVVTLYYYISTINVTPPCAEAGRRLGVNSLYLSVDFSKVVIIFVSPHPFAVLRDFWFDHHELLQPARCMFLYHSFDKYDEIGTNLSFRLAIRPHISAQWDLCAHTIIPHRLWLQQSRFCLASGLRLLYDH